MAEDIHRLVEWMRDPNRQPAELAFTSGPLRVAADVFAMETARAQKD